MFTYIFEEKIGQTFFYLFSCQDNLKQTDLQFLVDTLFLVCLTDWRASFFNTNSPWNLNALFFGKECIRDKLICFTSFEIFFPHKTRQDKTRHFAFLF